MIHVAMYWMEYISVLSDSYLCLIATQYILIEGTTQICRTLKLSINAMNENNNYYMNKPENLDGLRFDPGATHNLGECNRIPGHTSSGDLPQLGSYRYIIIWIICHIVL